MDAELYALTATAASLGLVHTVLGPDHYLPFIAMSRARGWSRAKTLWITLLCGIGHVASSVVIGAIGVALGLAVSLLEGLEGFRGSIAGWLLTAFGLIYLVWGIRQAVLNRPHTHIHTHPEDESHAHEHTHAGEHAHVHDRKARPLTPWVLFTIFVFGPCEPLIPLLMYPAAKLSLWGIALVSGVFAVATIGVMLTVVLLAVSGLQLVRIRSLARYSHALAGAVVFACGVAIQLGL